MQQYDIFWVDLEPTIGAEIKKKRPCIIISPDEMNRHLDTITVVPLTKSSKPYPSRIPIHLNNSWAVLDQIRTLSRTRFDNKIGQLTASEIINIKNAIQHIFVDV